MYGDITCSRVSRLRLLPAFKRFLAFSARRVAHVAEPAFPKHSSGKAAPEELTGPPSRAARDRAYRLQLGAVLLGAIIAGTSQAQTISVKSANATGRQGGYYYGTSPALIHANFRASIHAQLTRTTANSALGRMDETEFAFLIYHASYYAGGEDMQLKAIIAEYAPSQLARYRAVINAMGIRAAYCPAQGCQFDLPHFYSINLRMKIPNLGMTMTELWLEFRTAPGLAAAGELTGIPATAAYLTAYSAAWLSGAWFAGTVVGSGISWGIQTFAPGWWNALGGFEHDLVDIDFQLAIEAAVQLAGQCTAPEDLALDPCTG